MKKEENKFIGDGSLWSFIPKDKTKSSDKIKNKQN